MGVLYYSRLNITKEKPIKAVFRGRDQLRQKVNQLKSGRKCVYLVADDDEVYVTDNLELVVNFPIVLNKIEVHEYRSFEDAYGVALIRRKDHSLCYDGRYL